MRNRDEHAPELDIEQLDFDHCDDEPIHIPESIQSYGYLFAFKEDSHEIAIISKNVTNFIDSDIPLIEHNFFDLLEGQPEDIAFIAQTLDRAKERNTRLPLQIRFKQTVLKKPEASDYYAVVYQSDDLFVVEIEPALRFRQADSARQFIKLYAKSIAPKFQRYKSLQSMAEQIVETIKYITNMERVVLYKFFEDHSGKVIAEAKDDGIESYLDIHYPATDIPAQARELYTKNWVRLTPNANLPSSPLIPTPSTNDRKPLDMTQSLLRSLSPIHLQYVRNQGIKASMSMSLVTHNKLWGLISCHSREATYIPQNVRLECENLSQLFSWHLYAKEEELLIQKKETIDQEIERMLNQTSPDHPIVDVFTNNKQTVLDIMEADGFVFYSESETITIGTTPSLDSIRKLYKSQKSRSDQAFISTDISHNIASDQLNGIKGLLLVPLIERRDYFTAWFRKEHREIQKWVGSPEEKTINDCKKQRLMPRKAFSVHEKLIHGKSKPWGTNAVLVAERFNRVFMAHALEAQARAQQNLLALRKQDQYKNEFLATLAHELRNPLSPISAGMESLEIDEHNDAKLTVLKTMKRQLGYMTAMIDDLMDVSRITQGKVKLKKENLLIQEVIANAAESCRVVIEKKNHRIKIDLEAIPLSVRGDQTRLSQIFANLLNNAAKYTDSGGSITIVGRKIDDQVSIKVIDTGLGIPADKLEHIFSMFNQVKSHATNSEGGLGIGLTLVQRLVELHHGHVVARSDGPDMGSEFEVILPLVKTPRNVASTPDLKQPTQQAVERTRVLVVDDNKDITVMYEMLLESAGYETKTALNATEAIRIYSEFQPEFALLDIGMPGINGYELCKILTGIQNKPITTFLSQSGWGNKEDIEKSRKAGFAEHFVKPLSSKRLFEALNRHKQNQQTHE